MHTTEKNVDHLFGVDVQYQAPLYQRRYVWNETNWDALWNDIRSQADLKLRNENSRYFMGVLMIRPMVSDRLSRFEVIDGQQRLTTFQIILCALEIYVALLMDVFTRMIRGWKLSQQLTRSLTLNPLQEALRQSVREIHHSDQGVQYLSSAYISTLTCHGVEISLAQRGCPWENG